MRRPLLAFPVALAVGLPGAGMSARAQEPLLLHIRPNDAPLPEDGGSGERLSDEAIAKRARAAHEAVWQRAERRARIAIASVCTGCLPAAAPPEPSRPVPRPDRLRSAEASLPEPLTPTEGDP